MDREKLLAEAKMAVIDRGDSYGTPEGNFQKIADYWTLYKGEEFTVRDVGIMMMLLKVARSDSDPFYYDNYIDIAGYAAVTAEAIDVTGKA